MTDRCISVSISDIEYNRPYRGLQSIPFYTFCMEKTEKKVCSTARHFAENLAAYRSKKGFSQYDLAQITGISRTAISHYELEGIIPPADKLELLSHTLSIPVYKLFYHAAAPQCPTDLTDIDARSVKKFRDILSLSTEDRNDLYRILNKILRKSRIERQENSAPEPSIYT